MRNVETRSEERRCGALRRGMTKARCGVDAIGIPVQQVQDGDNEGALRSGAMPRAALRRVATRPDATSGAIDAIGIPVVLAQDKDDEGALR